MKKINSSIKFIFPTFRILLLLVVALICGFTGGVIEDIYRTGFWFGHSKGFIKGQADLVKKMTNAIGLEVNETNYDPSKYKFFKEIDGVRYYVYQGKEVKTLAVWE